MPHIYYPVIGAEQNLPVYVGGVGIEFKQDNIFRPKGFCYPQFIIFTEGDGEIIVDGKKMTLKKKCALFLPADTPHEYYSTTEVWQTWWVNFTGYDAERLLETLGFSKPMIISNATDDERLLRLLRNIYQNMKTDALFGNFYASGYLYEFLLEMYRYSNKILTSSEKSQNRLTGVIQYIDGNFTRKISMDELCKVSDLSEAHLCRLFKKYFGMRPMEYLNKKRIQRSKELLSISYVSVESASSRVGFDTPSYFGRLFRRYEGCSPSEYKEMNTNITNKENRSDENEDT